MRFLLEDADDLRADVTADVANGVDQAHHRAQDAPRKCLGRDGPKRRQTRKRSRDRQAQEDVGKPE